MSTRLRIFHATAQESVPVLVITLDPAGKAVFKRGKKDPAATTFIANLIGDGVDAIRENAAVPLGVEAVQVTPADGAAYLDAVEDMLGRSSRWIVVPQ